MLCLVVLRLYPQNIIGSFSLLAKPAQEVIPFYILYCDPQLLGQSQGCSCYHATCKEVNKLVNSKCP